MKSYVSGTADRPLIYQTIGEAFDEAVERWGDREALRVCHQDIRWTYRELATAVESLAAGLIELGLQPGDRIGIWSPNNAEWVATQFATAKAGLILVNINPAYRLSELEYSLNKVGCKALITARQFKSSDYVRMINDLAPELEHAEPGKLRAKRLPDLRCVIVISEEDVPGCFRFSGIASVNPEETAIALESRALAMQPDDAINIQFTSGTTGSPKGATLTHFNVLNNAYFVGQAMRLTENDRLCIPVPLYHCFGMVMSVLTCITHGATMVFPGEAFDPGSVLKAVSDERCTALHGVPTMFIAELEHPDFDQFDLSSLRTGVMAGAACPIEVMKRVVDDMGMSQVTICYGMTETSPVSFQSHVDDPIDKRVSTVGRIHPHVQVKVIDEDGRAVPRGQKGELCTRGYCIMLGYWGDPERSGEAIDSAGWMHTGDLAIIDDEGFCNIVGRVTDMIVRGGENVYPREIEEFLFTHPKIQETAVFGIPDDRFGEQVAAWVKLKEGESCTADELKMFCQEQIAHYKIPHLIEFVDEFPMTVTGKIQKFVMRKDVIDRLDLNEQATA